jgi:hypothetical protein
VGLEEFLRRQGTQQCTLRLFALTESWGVGFWGDRDTESARRTQPSRQVRVGAYLAGLCRSI